MSEATLRIKAWGNSLGVRIPSAVARAANLAEHQEVRLSVESGRVVIEPQAPRRASLAERLARFDPAVHGGEAMDTPPSVPSISDRGHQKAWVPDRQDIIWIDCNPQAGAEMRDMHPMVVLSPRAFNERTSLVIGLPMTTAPYNATNPFAVATAPSGKGKPAYVLCHQSKSFDWRRRHARPHPHKRMSDEVFSEACAVLNQIVAIA